MIAKKMLRMRLAMGLTQKGLAEVLGRHPDTIRNYETGKTTVPFDVYNETYSLYRDHRKAEKIQHMKKTACDEAA